MRFVAVDIGNSKTRLGLFQDAALQTAHSIPTDKHSTVDLLLQHYRDVFQEDITDLPLFVASVVPTLSHVLRDEVTLIHHESPLNFEIKRIQANTLGADIIAGSQAAVRFYQIPAIVIDAGTATTVTYINKEKAFLGGVICPGLGISAKALFEQTSALDPVDLVIPPSVIAHTTEHAIQGGLMFGHAGMITSLVERIKKEEQLDAVSVLCTGGVSHALLPLLPQDYIFDPELVLKGIASIAMNHYTH
ncbi:MAG: type III pantothenate kinase [Deltaproteobacteria bacterium]|nr:type III pantothenate kinase [Deltaproteobacteria bacterium]